VLAPLELAPTQAPYLLLAPRQGPLKQQGRWFGLSAQPHMQLQKAQQRIP